MFTIHTIRSAYLLYVNRRNVKGLGAHELECFRMEENMKICESFA